MQEEKNGKSKIDIDFQFLILNWKLNGRMTHGPSPPPSKPHPFDGKNLPTQSLVLAKKYRDLHSP